MSRSQALVHYVFWVIVLLLTGAFAVALLAGGIKHLGPKQQQTQLRAFAVAHPELSIKRVRVAEVELKNRKSLQAINFTFDASFANLDSMQQDRIRLRLCRQVLKSARLKVSKKPDHLYRLYFAVAQESGQQPFYNRKTKLLSDETADHKIRNLGKTGCKPYVSNRLSKAQAGDIR